MAPTLNQIYVRSVAIKNSLEGQTKIGIFSTNDFFIRKAFTSAFLRNINSKQILLTCNRNQILKLKQVGIGQSRKNIYVLPKRKFRIF